MIEQFKNKTVLITGHTGFKGSWLCTWLTHLGAKVVGASIDIPTTPSNFSVSSINNVIEEEVRSEKISFLVSFSGVSEKKKSSTGIFFCTIIVLQSAKKNVKTQKIVATR